MESSPTVQGMSKGRVESLSDGIFATVMTVLVLTLTVPVLAGSLTKAQLSSEVTSSVVGLLPDMLSYVLSFILLAVMWVSHHNIFHYLKHIDRPLIWFNIAFLLSVGFIPFSTALLGRYSLIQLPIVIYGANVVGIALSMIAFLGYGLRKGIIVAEGADRKVLTRIITRWRIGAGVYAMAIAISFASTEVSLAIYVVILALLVFQSAFGFSRLG